MYIMKQFEYNKIDKNVNTIKIITNYLRDKLIIENKIGVISD